MEEGPVEYKHCNLCDKDIEASKFRMHDIGCSRSNYRCPKCKKCVAKCDKEEHDDDECDFSEKVIQRKKDEQAALQLQKLEEEKRIKDEEARLRRE